MLNFDIFYFAIRIIMNFPNLSTFMAQGLSISAALFGFKSDFSKITCPSSQQINERIATKEPMEFSGFHYRDNSNRIAQNYSGHPVKKLNTVYIQTETDRVDASASCDYEDTRGKHFTLAMEPKFVQRLDNSKLNTSHWSSFFGGGLKDCGYSKMPEEKIREECSFTMKNK